MPTTSHVSLATQLLRDAAGFFRNVGEQNVSLKTEMFENAKVYEEVARLLESDPDGRIEVEED